MESTADAGRQRTIHQGMKSKDKDKDDGWDHDSELFQQIGKSQMELDWLNKCQLQ